MIKKNLTCFLEVLCLLLFSFSISFSQSINVNGSKQESLLAKIYENTDITWELNPYYTNVGFNVPLTGKPIPSVEKISEAEVYKRLFLNSLNPRFILLEAATYPMPLLGVYVKKNHEDFYGKGDLSGDINLISSLTAGFPEPWSFSVFFGDILNFVKAGEEKKIQIKDIWGICLAIQTNT